MTWIILEGLDRSGKSTVAEMYKNEGFEIIHMNAPNKMYFKQGYSGPSYLEEMIDLYSTYAGKDVLFDRSAYGELIWPEIYNRQALLTSEDFEYLQQLEYNNDTVKILMYDENKDAHWQRCVDNKEPLTRQQFVHATRLYEEMAKTHNFEKKQLKDFTRNNSATKQIDAGQPAEKSNDRGVSMSGILRSSDGDGNEDSELRGVAQSVLDKKLERANAIRDLLSAPIVKKKGSAFQQLEKDIKLFLEQQLENIFNEPKQDDFTNEEVKILKIYAQRIKEKLG
jgi:thymidylate kinase